MWQVLKHQWPFQIMKGCDEASKTCKDLNFQLRLYLQSRVWASKIRIQQWKNQSVTFQEISVGEWLYHYHNGLVPYGTGEVVARPYIAQSTRFFSTAQFLFNIKPLRVLTLGNHLLCSNTTCQTQLLTNKKGRSILLLSKGTLNLNSHLLRVSSIYLLHLPNKIHGMQNGPCHHWFRGDLGETQLILGHL